MSAMPLLGDHAPPPEDVPTLRKHRIISTKEWADTPNMLLPHDYGLRAGYSPEELRWRHYKRSRAKHTNDDRRSKAKNKPTQASLKPSEAFSSPRDLFNPASSSGATTSNLSANSPSTAEEVVVMEDQSPQTVTTASENNIEPLVSAPQQRIITRTLSSPGSKSESQAEPETCVQAVTDLKLERVPSATFLDRYIEHDKATSISKRIHLIMKREGISPSSSLGLQLFGLAEDVMQGGSLDPFPGPISAVSLSVAPGSPRQQESDRQMIVLRFTAQAQPLDSPFTSDLTSSFAGLAIASHEVVRTIENIQSPYRKGRSSALNRLVSLELKDIARQALDLQEDEALHAQAEYDSAPPLPASTAIRTCDREDSHQRQYVSREPEFDRAHAMEDIPPPSPLADRSHGPWDTLRAVYPMAQNEPARWYDATGNPVVNPYHLPSHKALRPFHRSLPYNGVSCENRWAPTSAYGSDLPLPESRMSCSWPLPSTGYGIGPHSGYTASQEYCSRYVPPHHDAASWPPPYHWQPQLLAFEPREGMYGRRSWQPYRYDF
ncbi:hypothetical protein IAU60_003341 [Kwoniella sp. DSM 27419]